MPFFSRRILGSERCGGFWWKFAVNYPRKIGIILSLQTSPPSSPQAKKSRKGLEVCYCLWGCHPDPRLGRSWARPGPILGPKRSRPNSPCALFYSISDPSRCRGGGHPGPSWSHPGPGCSFQDQAWTGRNRLLGHFRKSVTQTSLWGRSRVRLWYHWNSSRPA